MENITLPEFTSLVREKLKEAHEIFDVSDKILTTKILYDLKGLRFATAMLQSNPSKCILRFNVEAIRKYPYDAINDTIPHEVAHLVCMLNDFYGKNHNRGWKNVCKILGGSGIRTSNLPLTSARKQTRFIYELDDGTMYEATKRSHKQIQDAENFAFYMAAKWCKSKSDTAIRKANYVKKITVK